MSAFDEATLLMEINPPQSVLENNWYQGCGCCDDSRSCEHLKKHVTDKYLTRFQPYLSSVTRNLCYYYNT